MSGPEAGYSPIEAPPLRSHATNADTTWTIHADACPVGGRSHSGHRGGARPRCPGRRGGGPSAGSGRRRSGARSGDDPGSGPRGHQGGVQRRRSRAGHAHPRAGRGGGAFAGAVAHPRPRDGYPPLADAPRRGAHPARPHRAERHPAPGRGELRRAGPHRTPPGVPGGGGCRLQRDGGPAADLLRGRDGALDRVPRKQPGAGGAGRAAESAGAGGRPSGGGRAGGRRSRPRRPASGSRSSIPG